MKIRQHHPRWNRTEVFYRGLDVHEAFVDTCEHMPNDLSDDNSHEVARKVIKTTGQHFSIVLLSHAIGQLMHNVKEQKIDDH